MSRRISTIINVSDEALEKKEVFNAFVDFDSRLHVDPALLPIVSNLPEFKYSYPKFKEYFSEIITILNATEHKNDRFFRAAFNRLIFREDPFSTLGYSSKGTRGRGIGPGLAIRITITALELVKKGIVDPTLFELVGLLEEDIGADRISDMTIKILLLDFLKYTERVSKELKVSTEKFIIQKNEFLLPVNPMSKVRRPIIFLPSKLLRTLPLSLSWDDIDTVSKYNEDLREKVNNIIGKTWKKASKEAKKSLIKQTILAYPELLTDLIKQYNDKPKNSYDFKKDIEGEVVWGAISETAQNVLPLNLLQYFPVTPDNIFEITKTITIQFSKLIESNGWYEYLWVDKDQARHERFAQKLFYGVAEIYCNANNLDVSREPNAGSGALDFKISQGIPRVTVEIKYSTNPNLIKGFLKQLPTYEKAEGSHQSIYVVIRLSNSDNSIKSLLEIAAKMKSENKRIPEIIIIDGRFQVSASKRK